MNEEETQSEEERIGFWQDQNNEGQMWTADKANQVNEAIRSINTNEAIRSINTNKADKSDIRENLVDTSIEEGEIPTVTVQIPSINYNKVITLMAGYDEYQNYQNLGYAYDNKGFKHPLSYKSLIKARHGYPYPYPYDYSDEIVAKKGHAYKDTPFWVSYRYFDGVWKIKKAEFTNDDPLPCNTVYIKWINGLGGISFRSFKILKTKTKDTRKYLREFIDFPKTKTAIHCYDEIEKKEMNDIQSLMTSRRISLWTGDNEQKENWILIEIASLDLDIKSLTKAGASSQREVERLSTYIKKLKSSLNESNKELQQNKTALKSYEKQGITTGGAVYDLKKKIASTSKQIKDQSERIVVNNAQLKTARAEYNEQTKVIQAYKDKQNKMRKAYEQTDGSMQQIGVALRNNKKLYSNLTKEERENEKIGGKLLTLIKKQDEEYKSLNKSVGNTQVFVGSYEDAVKKALGSTGAFGSKINGVIGSLKNAKDGLVAMRAATKAQTVATSSGSKALRLFRVALISTGIGAIVVLIGSLAGAFLSTQKGIDAVNRALAPLKGAFKGIIGVVQKIATSVFSGLKDQWTITANAILIGINKVRIAWNRWTNDKEEANRLEKETIKLTEELTQARERSLERSKDILKTGKDATKQISDAVASQQKIEELKIEIQKAESDMLTNRAKLNKQIKEEELIAKNTSLTAKERNDASERAKELSKELLDGETAILKNKIKQMELEQSMNDTSREEIAALQQLKADLTQKETEQKAIELKFLSTKKSLQSELIAKQKKATEEAIKKAKVLLDIYLEENKGKKRGLEEEVKYADKIKDEKIAILKKELDLGKKTKEEYRLEELRILNEHGEAIVNATIDNAGRELKAFKEAHQSKLKANQLLNDQMVAQEVDRLDQIAEAERTHQSLRLENGQISQTEYNDAINEIDETNREAKSDLENTLQEQQREARAIDVENQRALDQENFNNDFERQLQNLEISRQRDIAIAEKTGADINLINEKHNAKRQEIDLAYNQAKLQQTANMFGGVAKLLGEHTAAGKAAGIAQATINTYQGVTEVWKAPAVLPEPFNTGSKILATATTLASGLATVQKITSIDTTVKKKMAKGGLVEIGGKRHAEGGTKFWGEDGTSFEAEKGEVIGVMNRNASRLFMEFNNAYAPGGFQRKNYFAEGGIVQREIMNQAPSQIQAIDYDLLAEKIGEANRELPAPITAVQDIIKETEKFNKVESLVR
ncbi:chromosome segregation ATPase-like protein [Elysia marginata]|uniref:Chromosome segregation ATPase-like protein n=1 Tax=Elysia marginata TaxID=1093978 RepID=A0AAV4G584_9GAST|nr:chromosome segregation ATPase-like protein [Elysia marginata]